MCVCAHTYVYVLDPFVYRELHVPNFIVSLVLIGRCLGYRFLILVKVQNQSDARNFAFLFLPSRFIQLHFPQSSSNMNRLVKSESDSDL